MWIASKFGFFSIVAKGNEFHVRTRVKQDLEQLLAETKLHEPVQVWPGADYRYRIIVGAADIPAIFQKLAESINYSNFKSMIGANPSQRDKKQAYNRIWSVMYEVQEEGEDEKL
jgi:hypothetical protein